ncbi:MAG: ATP-dependent DNA helicase RecG [Minisyncoccales bacterium]
MILATPIEKISRIGPQYQKRLNRLKIKTVGQLIFHFPFRYEDFSNITTIAQAEINKPVCLQGEITAIKNIRTFRKKIYLTEAELKDESGKIKVIWFNQPYLINTLKKGDFVLLTGKIVSKNGKKYLSSPAYEKIIDKTNFDPTHTGRIIPVYPETEGVSSRWLRFIIKPLLTKIRNQIPETLPAEILEKENLLPIREAIWQIHFPDDFNKVAAAKQRFVFEELFNLALNILWQKIKLAKEKAMIIPINLVKVKEFINGLPFKLTNDQKRAIWQILKDLEKPKPMNRLLNGDVGSGKTVVATVAAFNAVVAGFQVALMAPTEILAKQHFKTLENFLKPFKTKIGLITGKESFLEEKKVKKKEILEKTKEGQINLLIGTHALIQEEVEFKKLGLVIIDEQHRFGIEQRAKLCRKQKFTPHLLSMSATPIPRTLALTIYGDLDLSLIKEMPAGRKKIITRLVRPEERQTTYEFIRQEVKNGRQVFVICPRIEPSAKKNNEEENLPLPDLIDERKLAWIEVKAVKDEYEKLAKDIFPDLRIGMLHGKMKALEKEEVLKKFKNREIDILVATSVVEVGIDFPNATIMMIEGADKFGLAQLHQFRGRVGRGDHQSYCFLFSEFVYNPRLKAMTLYQDGFALAEKDLKLRGPGDLTGLRQWGVPDLVMASLLTDLELVERARQRAKEILEKDSNLENYPSLREKLIEFQQRIHLE